VVKFIIVVKNMSDATNAPSAPLIVDPRALRKTQSPSTGAAVSSRGWFFWGGVALVAACAATTVVLILQFSGSSSTASPVNNLTLSVQAVNGVIGRASPEPYKETTLCVLADCAPVSNERFVWTIEFVPWPDEINAPSVQTVTRNTGEKSLLVHEFTHPGYYNVNVTSKTHGKTSVVFNNVYARREIRNLTADEWNLYVDALWTLSNVSTENGRARFACPSGRQEDYHTHAFFVALHTIGSFNTTCDQLHFSMMQEFAHLGWNTMLEKSLQCVHPSVSLVYWNQAYDHRLYANHTLGAESLLRSPVWNSTYFGGRANYHNDTDNSNPHYFVKDGAFAYWPLRPNRTGVCKDMADMHPEMETDCNNWVDSDKTGWYGEKENAGFWFQEPRPRDAFTYISRRPGYLFGSNARALSNFPNDTDVIRASQQKTLVESMRITMGDDIHGRMHYWASGIWQPGTPLPHDAVADATSSEGKMTWFAWSFEDRLRFDGCYTCNETQCVCAEDSEQRGCWDNNIETAGRPLGSLNTQASGDQQSSNIENSGHWSYWKEYVYGRRVQHGPSRRNSPLYNCEVGATGTLQRSPSANQDPLFYSHHGFTFVVNDMAMQHLRDKAISSGPYYGLDNLTSAYAHECPGNNLYDVTIFSNLVPYTIGQTVGERHTWDHIMRMWDFPRRHFRWVLEGEM